jgi:hypothetical protein
MLETLKHALNLVLVVAILVMFFGLIARSNVRAARIFGWFCIAWALSVVIIEGYDWYSKGDWNIIPAQQIWYQIDRGSLNAVESAVERYVSLSAAAGVEWLLRWPAWLILGLGGVFLLVFDHVQLQRQQKGTPPPPLWRRIARAIRQITTPNDEEEAEV